MRGGAAAILIFLLAVPAAAQNGWVPGPGPVDAPGPVRVGDAHGGTWREEQDVGSRVRAGREAGQITRSEARGLRREARANSSLANRLGAGGLSASERRELDVRALVLRDRVTSRRSAPR